MTEISHFKKIRVDKFCGDGQKFRLMIRVKVKLKSDVVENREGKYLLYCCKLLLLLSRVVICGHTV